MYYGNVGNIGDFFNKMNHPGKTVDSKKILAQNKVMDGKISASDAFKNYYEKDSEGRISQDAYINFWEGRMTKDAAAAIFANYDKDGNGLDETEYAKYQKEYVQSRAGLKPNSNSLFDVMKVEQWETNYYTGIKKGKIDYSKFQNYIANEKISNNKEELYEKGNVFNEFS